MTTPAPEPAPRGLNREILALAVPAFFTLVSEPLYLLVDSAVVGHLGVTPLGGLGIATTVVGVLGGLAVFLAYGTTSIVARRLGAGRRADAVAGGLDAIALGVLLGLVVAALLSAAGPVVIGWFGAPDAVADQAWRYLAVSAWHFPALGVTLAATGVLRGLQDTRTPLVVAVTANLANIGLNLLFVPVLGLGIAGAAWATLLAQTGGALALATVVGVRARRLRVHWRFHPSGVLAAGAGGVWLVLRALSLQTSIVVTTLTATALGGVVLAGHQVTLTVWNALAFALDALAIACQAIIGRHLGAGAVHTVRAVLRRVVAWGALGGVAVGVGLALLSPVLGRVFTPDPAVQAELRTALLVVAALLPLAGVVFVLDGVLIGAGDARYLALANLLALLAYLPAVWAVGAFAHSLAWLWAGYGVSVAARCVTLVVRARSRAWLRTGAA